MKNMPSGRKVSECRGKIEINYEIKSQKKITFVGRTSIFWRQNGE